MIRAASRLRRSRIGIDLKIRQQTRLQHSCPCSPLIPKPSQASFFSWQQAVAASLAIGGVLVYTNINQNEASLEVVPSKPAKFVCPCNTNELLKEAHNPIVTRDAISPRRAILSVPNSAEITEILRENEASYLVNRGNGVTRFDTCQIASNNPIEDAHSEKMIGLSDRDLLFWGIYDGHRGWPTSAKLKQSLIGYVYEELRSVFGSTNGNPDVVDKAISRGFVTLDKEIVYDSVRKVMKACSKSLAAQILSPALSGSCALLTIYDSRAGVLRTACAGDSRAVLGRRAESGLWTAVPLSVDQTGGNPEEEARIRAGHPGEDTAVVRGRVLGHLEPSRSFGDGIYKWPVRIQQKLNKSFFARSPHKNTKTPPYVTAEPVITSVHIAPKNEDFVVMASDALWEMLTNEEVVGLVGQWKLDQEKRKQNVVKSPLQQAWLWIWPSSSTSLPVEQSTASLKTLRFADRPGQWELERKPEQYVCKDDNVATHIARNAFGGNQEDLMAGLLMLPTPNSRRYRDDLTITVIFFGEDRKTKASEEEP